MNLPWRLRRFISLFWSEAVGALGMVMADGEPRFVCKCVLAGPAVCSAKAKRCCGTIGGYRAVIKGSSRPTMTSNEDK